MQGLVLAAAAIASAWAGGCQPSVRTLGPCDGIACAGHGTCFVWGTKGFCDGDGIFEVRALYEEACRDVDCGPDGQCVAGICEDLLRPGPFDDPSIIDPDLSCGD